MKEILESVYFSITLRTIVILILASVTNRIITKTFDKDKWSSFIHMKFIKNILKAVVWVLAVAMIASQFPAFSKVANTILAGSGILAAIIGLAAQESFSNIFSGLFLSIFKPFNIGDRIKIVGDDTAGFVEDITLRHTVIRTFLNVRLIIPNSVIGKSKIENSTYEKGASYPIDVTIAYEDKHKRYRAMEIMEEVVTNHPLFYDNRDEDAIKQGKKPTTVLCTSLGESGINLRILMWTENFIDNTVACSECRMKILDRFEEEGIEIPYNKLVIVDK